MILAVDLGSTNIKAALFDAAGARIAETSRPLPYTVHSNARAELDPEAVTATFFGVLDDAMKRVGVPREALQTIGLSSQAQTFCLCDGEGKAVSSFLGWTDLRAGSEANELELLLGECFHATTGMPQVSAALLLGKALWQKRHGEMESSHRIAHLPSYLAMQLGARLCTDRNIAAMSGLYSIPLGGWWPEAIGAAGVTPGKLGDLVEPGERIPTCAERRPLGYSSDLKIVFAGNDHTAGAVGAGCRPGRPVLTLGTAGVLFRVVPEGRGPFPAGGIWGPFPGGSSYELLCLNHACSALDWADKFLFGRVDTPRFAREAESATGAEDLFFDPLRWGSPAAWSGVQPGDAMALAVFEGIAFALRDLVGEEFPLSGEGVKLLGGGARCDFWAQLLADIFQTPMQRSTRDGLDGIALLCGCELPPTPTATGIFSPRPENFGLLEKKYHHWRAAFR